MSEKLKLYVDIAKEIFMKKTTVQMGLTLKLKK